MNDRPELFAPVLVQSEKFVFIVDLLVSCNQQLHSSEPSSKTEAPTSHENALGSSFLFLVFRKTGRVTMEDEELVDTT